MYEVMRLPAESRPLLVFVNTRSGPQGGGPLLSRLRQILNPLQVWDLPGDFKGPEAALALFARVPRLRIVICGGDGTVGWVLQALDDTWEKLGLGSEHPKPPVAMMPLGTGNDLARTFQWASSEFWGLEKGMPDIDRFLRDVDKASVALLDRWSMHLSPQNAPGTVAIKRIINNYFSLGSDAKVTLDVHSTREAHPDWFQSQAGNKLWYVSAGAGEFIARSAKGISSQIQIECDGRVIQLPSELEGVVVLNINSFMGGVELWKSGSNRGHKSNKNLETILSAETRPSPLLHPLSFHLSSPLSFPSLFLSDMVPQLCALCSQRSLPPLLSSPSSAVWFLRALGDDSEVASTSSSATDSDEESADYGRFTPQQTHDGLLEVGAWKRARESKKEKAPARAQSQTPWLLRDGGCAGGGVNIFLQVGCVYALKVDCCELPFVTQFSAHCPRLRPSSPPGRLWVTTGPSIWGSSTSASGARCSWRNAAA